MENRKPNMLRVFEFDRLGNDLGRGKQDEAEH
jgi:hypothetical protein